nr:hypothetical protein BaRGS_013569 [Batillaria attramentaria]
MQQKIQTFLNTCLRRIFNIRWPEKIRNEELWERAGQETSGQADPAEEVGPDWTLQEASIQYHTPSPDMEPAGEKEERPALATAGGGTLRQGTNWTGVARIAQNRVRWRRVVDGLCSTWSQGPK